MQLLLDLKTVNLQEKHHQLLKDLDLGMDLEMEMDTVLAQIMERALLPPI